MLTRWLVKTSLPWCWFVASLYGLMGLANVVLHQPVPWRTLPRASILTMVNVSVYWALGFGMGVWLARRSKPVECFTPEGARQPQANCWRWLIVFAPTVVAFLPALLPHARWNEPRSSLLALSLALPHLGWAAGLSRGFGRTPSRGSLGD